MTPAQVPTGDGAALLLNPIVPFRLTDTRPTPQNPTGAVVAAGGTRSVQVAGIGAVPAGASGVVVTVTAVDPADAGYLTAFPCDTGLPNTSSVNFLAGRNAAASITVRLSATGELCVFASVTTHLLVDLSGWFGVDTGRRFNPDTQRLHDSRPAPLGSTELRVRIPGADAGDAAALNLTADVALGPGFVTAYPCGQTPPNVSNLNYVQGQTVANQATVRVGDDGQVCFVAPDGATPFIVDLQGTWTGNGRLRFVPVTPTRVLDSRAGIGAFPDLRVPGRPYRYVTNAVRADAEAVVGTLTVLNANRSGYAMVAACGVPTNASALNFTAASGPVPNAVYSPIRMLPTGGEAATCFDLGPDDSTPTANATGMADMIFDVTGWFVV